MIVTARRTSENPAERSDHSLGRERRLAEEAGHHPVPGRRGGGAGPQPGHGRRH
ncbi:hypothetical protein ACRAWD_27590 [Caulobacter segnis]